MGETLGGTNNTGGTDSAGQGCCGGSKKQFVMHVGLSKHRKYEGKQKENIQENESLVRNIKERRPGKSDRLVEARKVMSSSGWHRGEHSQVYIEKPDYMMVELAVRQWPFDFLDHVLE